MTIDGFLTFLTLIVAVYAVIPKVSRRTIDLKLGLGARCVAVSALVFILLLELYEPIHTFLRIPSFGLSRFGLYPQNVAFVILVLTRQHLYRRIDQVRHDPASPPRQVATIDRGGDRIGDVRGFD
jgi:hypothetical protein